MLTFDHDIERTLQEVKKLEDFIEHKFQLNQQSQALDYQLAQEQKQFSQTIQQMIDLTQKTRNKLTAPINSECASITNWCFYIAQNSKKYLEDYFKIKQKKLWLKITKERCLQKPEAFSLESIADTLNVAQKISELSLIEKTHDDKISELEQSVQTLQREYRAKEIANSNWQASSTLHSKLGKNKDEVFNSPVTKQLSSLLQTVHLCNKSGDTSMIVWELESEIQNAQQEILIFLQSDPTSDSKKRIQELEDSIKKSKETLTKYKNYVSDLEKTPLKISHPFIVDAVHS